MLLFNPGIVMCLRCDVISIIYSYGGLYKSNEIS